MAVCPEDNSFKGRHRLGRKGAAGLEKPTVAEGPLELAGTSAIVLDWKRTLSVPAASVALNPPAELHTARSRALFTFEEVASFEGTSAGNHMRKLIDAVIGLAGLGIVIVLWTAAVLGVGYVLDWSFLRAGAFSEALNKIVSAGLILLPGFIAYFLTQEAMKRRTDDYNGLSINRKIVLHAKHFAVLVFVCFAIAYGTWPSCDDAGNCEYSEPLTSDEKRVTFLRLTMVSLVGMVVAYRKFLAAGDR